MLTAPLALGLAGFGLGMTVGAWEQYGFAIPISKGQVVTDIYNGINP